ncbi:hypothetical protein T265_08185 [Opisthorchis viverrini]|uniref:UFSP1/2/DUB catalytic domain-containing protein n=1 Tax=Opisthorchis viverrini TaxID=6198 RepID=A0A074ZEK3_OPIVI|nr:hypothetical protein T265_08185 [Opisthorchis viverrini]KER24097.1 hypothetical protein T265_08185 [Opisthorchis viverrini]
MNISLFSGPHIPYLSWDDLSITSLLFSNNIHTTGYLKGVDLRGPIMSTWRVARRDENQETDYGSMHLNETPSLYAVTSPSPRLSAQVLATEWLNRNFETNRISLVEYRTRLQELRRAVRLGIDSASTCTDGIISSLRQLMLHGWLNNRWRLVSVDCDHFASEAWEESFVCCYRNAQCILSSLFRLPDFRKRLFGALSAMPSVWKLQALLESAWTLGFDPVGASQLASALRSSGFRTTDPSQPYGAAQSTDERNLVGLVDSTAWLGASDLVSLFGSIGVRCSLLECRAPSGPNDSHPRLLEHVHSYIVTGRSSSTSLEVDEDEQPVALIVLDPNVPVDAMRQIAKAAEYARQPNASVNLSRLAYSTYNWMDILGSLRVDVNDLKHPQYQLLQINGLIENEVDLQDAMTPENVTIAIS